MNALNIFFVHRILHHFKNGLFDLSTTWESVDPFSDLQPVDLCGILQLVVHERHGNHRNPGTDRFIDTIHPAMRQEDIGVLKYIDLRNK